MSARSEFGNAVSGISSLAAERSVEDLTDFAVAAAKRRVTAILLTDQWLSPAARVAKFTLPARVSVPSAWDSSAALLAIIESLIADVMAQRWTESRKRMTLVEGLRGRPPDKES